MSRERQITIRMIIRANNLQGPILCQKLFRVLETF